MDASTAFDRIKHDKLSKILQDRGIHLLVLRLIIDMCKRQKSRTLRNNVTGGYFNSINGVRQGGVVSPLMFTVYIDDSICRLQKSGIGCFIGQEYYGCLSYADDFVLLCTSVKGLHRMVDLCSNFGLEFSVTYNAKKTKCMKFELKPVMHETYPIRLEGKVLLA